MLLSLKRIVLCSAVYLWRQLQWVDLYFYSGKRAKKSWKPKNIKLPKMLLI